MNSLRVKTFKVETRFHFSSILCHSERSRGISHFRTACGMRCLDSARHDGRGFGNAGPLGCDSAWSRSFCFFEIRKLLPKKTIILAALVGCLTAIAQTPERKVVNNNILISDRDPKVRIELPKSVWYVGVDRFILLDIADCELYAFVEV